MNREEVIKTPEPMENIKFYYPIVDSDLLEVEYQHKQMTPEECILLLLAQVDRLTAENERLKEYAQHKQDCSALQKFFIAECPECGNTKSHWRHGIGFDHEQFCEICENVWEPKKRNGECTCGLEETLKGGD